MVGYAKVEGEQALVRDIKNNAILNTDVPAKEAYKVARAKARSDRQRIEALERGQDEINRKLDILLSRGAG